MKRIRFSLEGRVPSAKNSKRIIPVGGRHIPINSKAYARFLKEQIASLQQQIQDTHVANAVPMAGKLAVKITFNMKGKGASDGDNMENAILDLLQKAGVIENDGMVMQCRWEKVIGMPDYSTSVEVIRL